MLFSRVERKAVPIHDWTRVDAGLFHAFRFGWITTLSGAPNRGALPSDYFALIERRTRGAIDDFLDLQLPPENGCAVRSDPRHRRSQDPALRWSGQCFESEANLYARKADRITVRHEEGRIVAVIEIVSPGNKGSTNPFRTFVEKTSALIAEGIHVLVIDLFPPTKRDPQGIHKAIWDEIEEEDFDLPADKPLVLAAYEAGLSPVAYVEPIAVGDVLPDMPIFLEEGYYVPTPLEATYQTAWNYFPAALKGLLKTPPGNL